MTHLILFWGKADIYSNFHPATFRYKDLEFNCSEQTYMWEKAMYFSDTNTAEKIMKCKDPALHKKLGRGIKGFNDASWSRVKRQYMFDICFAKFSQNEHLRAAILETGNAILVEASPYDKVWGIGWGKNSKEAYDPEKWRGLNLLGKVLMDVRAQLQEC